jgi:hypothetical protein
VGVHKRPAKKTLTVTYSDKPQEKSKAALDRASGRESESSVEESTEVLKEYMLGPEGDEEECFKLFSRY